MASKYDISNVIPEKYYDSKLARENIDDAIKAYTKNYLRVYTGASFCKFNKHTLEIQVGQCDDWMYGPVYIVKMAEDDGAITWISREYTLTELIQNVLKLRIIKL